MNDKFYNLPEEKQQRIINAGFRIFSENSYRKSPVSEIAKEAGISKALLFFYFKNKKELYLFLWNEAANITMKYLEKYQCYNSTDLFEMMEHGMRAKFKIMEQYPCMTEFAIRAFYEKDEAICLDIQNRYRQLFDVKAASALSNLNPNDFVPGLDLQMMYREMYWASEGYLWEMLQRGGLDSAQMEEDFSKLLVFWKNIYLRQKNPEQKEEKQ